jgi:hypothetical protein
MPPNSSVNYEILNPLCLIGTLSKQIPGVNDVSKVEITCGSLGCHSNLSPAQENITTITKASRAPRTALQVHLLSKTHTIACPELQFRVHHHQLTQFSSNSKFNAYGIAINNPFSSSASCILRRIAH